MYRFGSFELSTEDQQLRKNGLLIRLPPQPLQVLLMLLEKPGTLVTRDELRDKLWGETQTNVEFDAGVNRCIRQIRAVLNDNSDSPRYVETIPRQGYRFIAKVETVITVIKELPPQPAFPPEPVVIGGPVEIVSEQLPPVLPPARKRSIWIYWGSIAALLTVIAGVWFWRRSTVKHPVSLTPVPLAVALGDHYAPAFSPDGRQVAFSWNGESRNNYDIYIKDVNSQAPPLRLTTDQAIDYSPTWSPDGNWIAFVRASPGKQGVILLIHPLGGAEHRLHTTTSFPVANHRDLAWTPDSKLLIVSNHLNKDGQSQIASIHVETDEVKVLLSAPEGEFYLSPAVSPDGNTIAFTRDVGPGVSSIMLYSPEKSDSPRALPAQAAAFGNVKGILNHYAAWTPDGKYIVFSSDFGGGRHLWLAPVEGNGPMERLDALGDGLSAPFLSSKGQLAYVREEYDTNIWRLDLNRAISDPRPNPLQVVSSTRLESNPAISPDGKKMAFSSDQSGFPEIWVSDIDGKNAEPLTSMRASVTGSPTWSPDGLRLAFDSRAEGQPSIYVIDSTGGRATRLTSGVVPHWSPDGKWIYYSSETAGRMEIWRVTLSGEKPEQITKLGGFAAVTSSDGKTLYFNGSNEQASPMWEMDLESRSPTLIADSVLNRAFGFASNRLVYIQGKPDSDEHSLFGLELATRKPKLLLGLQHRIDRGVALSSDGDSLFYTGIDRAAHELLIVDNFWQ